MKKLVLITLIMFCMKAYSQNQPDYDSIPLPSVSFSLTVYESSNKLYDRRLIGAKSIDFIIIEDVIIRSKSIPFDPLTGEVSIPVRKDQDIFIQFKKH